MKPFTREIETKIEQPTDGSIIIDFTKSIDVPIMASDVEETTSTGKKKRGRPRKNDAGSGMSLFSSPSHMTQVAENFDVGDDKSKRELSFMETNEPYEKKYQETNNILRSAIVQLDSTMTELQGDIEDIRHSKTMRNKYQYLSLLQGSMGTMIANKISAARELNNTISKCNDFEMKRYKEIKAANAANDGDDDQRVMEMYKAFVNTPVSTNPFPNVSQMAIAGSPVQTMAIGSQEENFANYLNNLTPQQNMMHLEENPNIQQVVVYNQENGARYFDVIDMSTGQSVPNAEKHDAMFLEDITIDLKNKVARNINIGETYPLVLIGQPLMNEY
jgi:hypothetical protein|nr:MAG TPA: RFX5 DNA-binding domain protein [Caudoviricetes sp.]